MPRSLLLLLSYILIESTKIISQKNKSYGYGLIAFLILNFLFSIYLYSHVIEKSLFIDIPYVSSISISRTPFNFLYSNGKTPKKVIDTKDFGFYGRPQIFRIPKFGVSFEIANPLLVNDVELKISNNKLYYYPIDKSNHGLLGDSVIFAGNNFYGLDIFKILDEGDRLIITTDKSWNYTYRISNKYVAEISDYQLLDDLDTSKIIIVRDNVYQTNALVVEADFNSLEEGEL